MAHNIRLHISGISIGPFYQHMDETLDVTLQELPTDREHRQQVDSMDAEIMRLRALLAMERAKPWYKRLRK